MDINDTAYNEYILCSDCESGNADIVFDSEYECPRWSTMVKNVGICKHYRKVGMADGNPKD